MANKPTEKNTEKMVKIKIPLERGKANKDVFVSVNDRTWQIKRGIAVEVPECVAEVLQHEEEQLLKAAEYQEAMASE
jgi:hypothetical protein